MYERFVQLLDERGITAYQVYKDTGVSQSVLSAWKKGVSTPRPITLRVIADYFGVSVAYLKGETDDRGQKKAPTQEGERKIGFDDFTYAFYEESKDLPDEKKKMLLDMARFMKADIDKGKG